MEEARLLDVILVDKADLSKYFLTYESDEGNIRLPSGGKCMMLIFLKPTHAHQARSLDLFTKLRKFFLQDYKYYKRNIGQVFKVHIAVAGEKDGSQLDLFEEQKQH